MDILTFFSAFTYGLSSSLSLCLASCLPFYIPILFGFGEDPKKGFILSLGFVVGRLVGYLSLGAVAAFLGAAFIDFFSNTYPSVAAALIFIFGFMTIYYGVLILAEADLRVSDKCGLLLNTGVLNRPVSATFTLGFVSTIRPCAPVFTFLLLPFAMGKVVETSLVTVAFGLGANIVFIVLGVAAGFGVKNVRERFIRFRRPLQVASAAALTMLGLFYVAWVTGPLVLGLGGVNYMLPSVYDLAYFTLYVLRRILWLFN